MKHKISFFLCLFIFSFSGCYLYGQTEPTKEQVEKGWNYLETQVYTQEENLAILELFKNAQVSDVCDAMDFVGLPNTGLVDPKIQTAWTDPTPKLRHTFVGIALTVRYVPTQRSNRPEAGEDFSKWAGYFYSVLSPEKFVPLIQKGSVIVRDGFVGREDSGIGSNNALSWISKGAVGILTNGTLRDHDECRLEMIPVYYLEAGRGIRPGRSELESVNRPVEIGGVLVFPGDIVVADGDGVIVVPRKVAVQVAKRSQKLRQGDNDGRAKLYKKLGMQDDGTL